MKKKKASRVYKEIIFNALQVGRNQALSRSQLTDITGIGDRQIREAIEFLREDYAILTLPGGNGYYIPPDTPQGYQEAREWMARQNRRARSIKRANKGVQRFLETTRTQEVQIPGQLSIFGIGRA